MKTDAAPAQPIPSPLQMALVPGAITLGVTLLRFTGELTGGPAILFGNPKDGAPALIAIFWLVFLFGGRFGYRLHSYDQDPKPLRRRLCVVTMGLILGVAAVTLSMSTGLVTAPGTKGPDGDPLPASGLPYLLLGTALPAVAAWIAWPQLARTMLVYAVLARLPVVVLTGLCFWFGCEGTHYTAIPDPVPETRMERFLMLSTAQVTVWPFLTIAFGTLAGACVAALTSTRSKPDPVPRSFPGVP